jgi:Arc/MetJ-type ribon-helix-helix transcriptional regulator
MGFLVHNWPPARIFMGDAGSAAGIDPQGGLNSRTGTLRCDIFIPTANDCCLSKEDKAMGMAVKKTISLPPDLLEDAERVAREEGKTLSAVVQEALRLARRERLGAEWKGAQSYWSARAREKGLLKEEDLDRFLRRR